MKKLLGIGVGALALGALVGLGNSADAATQTLKYTLNYADQQLKIENWDTSEVLVGYGTPNTKGALTIAKEDTIDLDNGDVTIDLSHLNFKKDNCVTLRSVLDTAQEDVKLLYIPKQLSSVGVNVSYGDKVSVTLQDATDKKNPTALAAGAEFQYRTANGGWNTFTAADDFSMYVEKGASLIFRVGAGSDEEITFGAKTQTAPALKLNKVDVASYTYKAVDANKFPSVEAKAKINKRANAPAITPNYATQTVGVVAGEGDALQARIVTYYIDTRTNGTLKYDDTRNDGKWYTFADAALYEEDVDTDDFEKTGSGAKAKWNVPLAALKIPTESYGIGYLEIRTAPDSEKGKPASAINRILLNKISALTAAGTIEGTDEDAHNVIGYTAAGENVSVVVNGKLELKLDIKNNPAKGKTAASVDYTVNAVSTETAESKTSYKVVLLPAGEKPNAKTKNQKAVAATKTVAVAKQTKVAEGAEAGTLQDMHVWVYRVENKKSTDAQLQWASEWVDAGVISTTFEEPDPVDPE